MRKIMGILVTVFVFLLGLLGVASAEEVPGRSVENRHKTHDLEMEQKQGKFQNLETDQARWKVDDLEAGKSGQADQTKAVDMFRKRDKTKRP